MSVEEGTLNSIDVDSSGNSAIISSQGGRAVDTSEYYLAQQGKVYLASYDVILTASLSEASIGILKNPSGNTKNLHLLRIAIVNLSSSTNDVIAKLYKNPTITANGTVSTPITNIIGGNQAVSGMSLFIPPGITVSANGTRLYSMSIRSTPPNFNALPILVANNNLLLTVTQLVASQTINISLIWAEV